MVKSSFSNFANLNVDESKIFYIENEMWTFCLYEKDGHIINARNNNVIIDSSHAFIENGIFKIRFADEYNPILSAIVRSEEKCAYCGREIEAEKVTVEHIMPKCRGGATVFENIAPACSKCNNKKTFFTLDEFHVYKNLRKSNKQSALVYLKDCEKRMFEDKEAGKFGEIQGVVLEDVELEKIIIKPSLELADPPSPRKALVERRHVVTYGRPRRPLVVDRNFVLLESKYLYKLVAGYEFNAVPTIILQNVECTES